jgi:hypothetical protein
MYPLLMHVLVTSVIKLELARQVDLVARPGRVRQKTSQCNNSAKPARPGGSTHDRGDLGEPRQDPIFFSNVVFLLYPSFFKFF